MEGLLNAAKTLGFREGELDSLRAALSPELFAKCERTEDAANTFRALLTGFAGNISRLQVECAKSLLGLEAMFRGESPAESDDEDRAESSQASSPSADASPNRLSAGCGNDAEMASTSEEDDAVVESKPQEEDRGAQRSKKKTNKNGFNSDVAERTVKKARRGQAADEGLHTPTGRKKDERTVARLTSQIINKDKIQVVDSLVEDMGMIYRACPKTLEAISPQEVQDAYDKMQKNQHSKEAVDADKDHSRVLELIAVRTKNKKTNVKKPKKQGAIEVEASAVGALLVPDLWRTDDLLLTKYCAIHSTRPPVGLGLDMQTTPSLPSVALQNPPETPTLTTEERSAAKPPVPDCAQASASSHADVTSALAPSASSKATGHLVIPPTGGDVEDSELLALVVLSCYSQYSVHAEQEIRQIKGDATKDILSHHLIASLDMPMPEMTEREKRLVGMMISKVTSEDMKRGAESIIQALPPSRRLLVRVAIEEGSK